MLTVQVAHTQYALDRDGVEQAMALVDPDPLVVFYAVVNGRRYPPKQVVAAVTGLERGDFTTHQARSILRRLGFGVQRRGAPQGDRSAPPAHDAVSPLEPFVGRWVAQVGDDVLYDDDSPEKVVAWMRRHGKSATVWRIPDSPASAGSMNSSP